MTNEPTNGRHSKLYDHTPDASLPERVTRSAHEIAEQIKQHGVSKRVSRSAPVPTSINLGYLTDPLKFDLLETFFSTQRGHDIQIQWMLHDLQGLIPPAGNNMTLTKMYTKMNS